LTVHFNPFSIQLGICIVLTVTGLTSFSQIMLLDICTTYCMLLLLLRVHSQSLFSRTWHGQSPLLFAQIMQLDICTTCCILLLLLQVHSQSLFSPTWHGHSTLLFAQIMLLDICPKTLRTRLNSQDLQPSSSK
jgi:multisubunit Na+/H+ antiporter MnhF subunit